MRAIGRHVAKLSGYAPALPTPFDDNGDVDGEAFERLCDLQVTCGATALIVCGTTGEASTLTPGEQGDLIRIAVGVSRGRVPVIAGAGSMRRNMRLPRSKMPKRAAPTRCCPSCLIITSRHRQAFTPISVRLPPRPDCRSSSTTFHRELRAPLPMLRSRGLPSCHGLSASRTPAET